MKIEYNTKPRNAIMDYLQKHADTRFTARDILKGLNTEGEQLDRSTVYRNLERLCQEGKLVKYKEADLNASCYQYTEHQGSCQSHTHAQCDQCGKIFHLENDVLADAAKKMKDTYGIELDYSKTVIMCKCDACSHAK